MAPNNKYRIGIDIGNNSIKLVAYDFKKNSKLSRLAQINLVKEERIQAVDDQNETEMLKAVQEIIHELPYKKSSIRICLSAEMNNVFMVRLPQVGENEIKQTLYWELGPLLPKPVKNYEYDYRIVKQDNKKKEIFVLAGVYDKQRMKRIMKVFSNLGKDVDIFETDTLPAINLYLNKSGGLKEPLGFLQLGAAHSQYTVLIPGHNPGFLFIPFGGNTLNNMIMDQKEVSFFMAESMRHKKDKKDSSKSSWLFNSQKNSVLQDNLERLADSVIRFNLYHHQKTDKMVNKIIVTGGLLNDNYISKTLQKDAHFFHASCEFWDPLKDYFPSESLEQYEPYHFTTALSLALI